MGDSRGVRVPIVTMALVAAPLAGLVAAAVAGLAPAAPSAAQLIDAGASYGPRTLAGEPWRLLTAAGVHAGLAHLAINVVALAVVAAALEARGGRAVTALAAVGAAIVGAAAGTWRAPYAVIAGASSAAIGVAAALAVVVLAARPPPAPRDRLRLAIAALVIAGFGAVGVVRDDVDHAGHLAGALAGGVVALPCARRRARPGRAALLGAGGAFGLAAALVAAAQPAPVEPRAATARLRTLEARLERLVAGDAVPAPSPALADTLARDVAAPLEALARDPAYADPRLPPRLRERVARLQRYAAARARVVRILARAVRSGAAADARAIEPAARAAAAVLDGPLP